MHATRSAQHILLPLFSSLALSLALQGCGLLLGNVKPVTEKAEDYGILDLSAQSPKIWTKLDSRSHAEDRQSRDTSPSEVSDVAYQAISTPSIIALNSGCRPSVAVQKKELRELTEELLLGFTEIQSKTEKNLTVSGSPALETTVEGKMAAKPIRLRTTVLRKNGCVYDLLYMSSPVDFPTHESDFSNFVTSLRLK